MGASSAHGPPIGGTPWSLWCGSPSAADTTSFNTSRNCSVGAATSAALAPASPNRP